MRPRPALALLLAGTAVLYLWKLSASGYGNAFYAAAAQAGAQSWKAWFFGSLDAGNFVTVDKPPAATWVSGLSVRLFGMNTWAVLVPQALIGVATVAAAVCDGAAAVSDPRLGAAAGLLAGATGGHARGGADLPVQQPRRADGAADGPRRLLRDPRPGRRRTRWLRSPAGVALGFGFLTKMFAGVLVLPAFALVYLSPRRPRAEAPVQSLVAGAAMLVVAAGWWVADRGAVARRQPVPTSVARPTTACSTWRSATTG